MSNMPVFVKIFILAFWLLTIPAAAGGLFGTKKAWRTGGQISLPFAWLSGQFLLWAVFQMICVPCVLLEKDFSYVVYGYGAASLLFSVIGCVGYAKGAKGPKRVFRPSSDRTFWIVFAILLIFQLVQAVGLAYGDGDDAYYVAVSGITENADTMYQKLPYTGGTTGVDIRHGLAPFPIWIAFLARISGIPAVSVAHVAVPLVLIPMTYLIFYLLGQKLFAGKESRIPLFLIFTELLVLFGDYSFYTVEHFMLARSRQGKAALGSIVLPMLFYLMFVLLERLQEHKKCGLSYWLFLLSVMTAGCLCTTMGAFLACLLVAVTGMCAAVCYRRWKVLVPMALCCVPCVCFALIYMMN